MEKKERKGILAAGNWIIDRVKIIDKFPHQDGLANIITESSANGGAAYNVLKDLALLKAPFPLFGIGMVGDDPDGQAILNECRALGIDTEGLLKTSEVATSYTDVMTVQSELRRTFFHKRGANAKLSVSHFDFSAVSAKIFHLGYLLLLDQLDEVVEDSLTGAAVVLKAAQEQEIITSVDVVSESSDRFKKIVPPALPFVNYLFINEYEAEKVTDLILRDKDEQIQLKKVREAGSILLDMGVNDAAIIHFPQGAYAMSQQTEIFQPSVKVPTEAVKGAAGAGDAFAAGVLMGIHQGWEMKKSLELGVCSAAASLHASTCSDGVVAYPEALEIGGGYGYRTIS